MPRVSPVADRRRRSSRLLRSARDDGGSAPSFLQSSHPPIGFEENGASSSAVEGEREKDNSGSVECTTSPFDFIVADDEERSLDVNIYVAGGKRKTSRRKSAPPPSSSRRGRTSAERKKRAKPRSRSAGAAAKEPLQLRKKRKSRRGFSVPRAARTPFSGEAFRLSELPVKWYPPAYCGKDALKISPGSCCGVKAPSFDIALPARCSETSRLLCALPPVPRSLTANVRHDESSLFTLLSHDAAITSVVAFHPAFFSLPSSLISYAPHAKVAGAQRRGMQCDRDSIMLAVARWSQPDACNAEASMDVDTVDSGLDWDALKIASACELHDDHKKWDGALLSHGFPRLQMSAIECMFAKPACACCGPLPALLSGALEFVPPCRNAEKAMDAEVYDDFPSDDDTAPLHKVAGKRCYPVPDYIEHLGRVHTLFPLDSEKISVRESSEREGSVLMNDARIIVNSACVCRSASVHGAVRILEEKHSVECVEQDGDFMGAFETFSIDARTAVSLFVADELCAESESNAVRAYLKWLAENAALKYSTIFVIFYQGTKRGAWTLSDAAYRKLHSGIFMVSRHKALRVPSRFCSSTEQCASLIRHCIDYAASEYASRVSQDLPSSSASWYFRPWLLPASCDYYDDGYDAKTAESAVLSFFRSIPFFNIFITRLVLGASSISGRDLDSGDRLMDSPGAQIGACAVCVGDVMLLPVNALLRRRICSMLASGGGLAPAEATQLVRRLCEALSFNLKGKTDENSCGDSMSGASSASEVNPSPVRACFLPATSL